MKVIIDIPKDVLKRTVFYREFRNLNDCVTTIKALEKAVPLPKGHGALKDVDKIGLTNFECLLCNGDYKEALKMLIDKIENADTIIGADEEGENDNN